MKTTLHPAGLTSILFSIMAGCMLSPVAAEAAERLGDADLERIGRRIWRNECDGTVEGLTSWNAGENFASLGIGHFIWYPPGVQGPFEESFPPLLEWLKAEKVPLPKWLAESKHCPWPDKRSFEKDHGSDRQKELRKLLAATLRPQVRFIIHRLQIAVPKYREAAGAAARRVEENIGALSRSAAGNFAMIDYINFKGDGLNPKERYQGEGWGLLQVLQEMEPGDQAAASERFAAAAKKVLTRRVKNSPPERGEKRWLEGWRNRCASYAE